MKKNEVKFYEFKNSTKSNEAELYVYGDISSEKWWDSDVTLEDFKEVINDLKDDVETLNLYVNSGGGSVFVASAMTSILQRAKETKNITINAFVDGLAASAASYLIMVADNIYIYENSMLMIHKPMSYSFGNANDFQKTINELNKIEESVMLPLYMKKAKVEEDVIKEMIDAETWMDAKEIAENFNVVLLEEEKKAVASISKDLFKNYKNVPSKFKNENAEKDEVKQDVQEDAQDEAKKEPEHQNKNDDEIAAKTKAVSIKLKLFESFLKLKEE